MAFVDYRQMIYNLNTTSCEDSEYDVAIIGSGPAGISCALKLLDDDIKVAVLEGGGEYYSKESLEPYKGQTIGDKYFDLQFARQRFFGGSSNHWSGWCRALDSFDYEYKSFHELANWPIKKTDLDPYLSQASKILEIKDTYDDQIVNNQYGIKKISFNRSSPVRFGEKYKKIFQGSNHDLYLNSNLINFQKNGSTFHTGFFRSFTGKSLKIKSRVFVLATGGIENSRLMLALNQKNADSLFKKDMPIGNYWMEHPHFIIGESVIPRGWKDRYLALTGSKKRELGILNCRIRFDGNIGQFGLNKMIRDIACYAPETGKYIYDLMERQLVCGATIHAAWEQAPIKNNKITLSNTQKDIFGIPRPILHYKKSSFDKRTVYESIKQIALFGNSLSYGKIKLFDFVSSLGNYPDNDELAGYHHMGGTRMSDSNEIGVVDRNLKVHGADNFFVAGSSVFPSGGHANPTLSIVQLSLKLGQHIKNFLK